METYSQYIKDTRKAWAKMPKTNPLNENITMQAAIEMLDMTDEAKCIQDQIDLAAGEIVYLADNTNLRKVTENTVRHYR